MPDPDSVSTASERSAYARPDPAPEPAEGASPLPPAPAAPADDPAPPSPEGTTAPPPAGSGFLERLPWWAVPLILLGVPLLFGAATQVVPEVYDDVVWKYYWGPIKADADNDQFRCFDGARDIGDDEAGYRACIDSGGVLAESGYNVVNTLSWAVLLGVCILGIAQMLATFRTTMADKLIVAATAWVVVGSVAHVLEDVGLFSGALQYFFITPPIYLLFGAFGIASFLVAQWMRSIAAKSDLHGALRMLWMLHMLLALLWLGLWLNDWPQVTVYVNPVWVAAFAAINYLVARAIILRQGRIDASLLTLAFSLGTFLLVGAYVVTYVTDPWNDLGGDGMPLAFLIAPALAAVIVAGVYLLAHKAPKAILGTLLVGGSLLGGVAAVAVLNFAGARIFALLNRLGVDLGPFGGLEGTPALVVALVIATAIGARWWMKSMRPGMPVLTPLVATAYALGINLLLVFSQLVDAISTALGVDLIGYSEKHVLSGRVLDGFRDFSNDLGWTFAALHPTFFAFVPLKLMVSLLVVYAIDVHSREDARTHPTLIGLVKFAIIMVGLGPGVRNFTRMSLGV